MKSFRGFRTLLVAGAAVLLVAGCGDDKKDDNGGNGDASVRKGTWSVKSTTTVLGTATTCQGIPPEVTTEDEVICGDEDLTGGEDTAGLGCEINVSGNTIDIDCELTTPVGPCSLKSVITGSGTFSETSYDITIDFTTTATGTDPSCAQLNNPCTTRTRVQGTWKNATGNCTGKPSGIRQLTARNVGLAASRMH